MYSAAKFEHGARRTPRNRFALVAASTLSALTLAGCGNQYRPVISAINPVGPAGQPTKFAVALSNPGATGLLTVVDFSGDTILSTPQVLANPTYFQLNPNGTAGYAINAQGGLDTIPLTNPATLLTSSVAHTTLAENSGPVSISSFTPASEIGSLFIPQRSTGTIAALNSGTGALYDDISVGQGGSNPVYVVGANSTPRVYAISQNSPGSLGQIDAFEATSTLQLADSATIPVGVRPVYGVMTADNRRAFILNQGSGTVSVVNVPSNALDVTTPTITLPAVAVTGGPSVAAQPVWADLAPGITEMVVLNRAADATGKSVAGTLNIVQIPLCNAIAQPTNPNCNSANPIDAVGFGQIVATAKVGIDPTMVSILQDNANEPRAYVVNSLDSTGTCAAGEGSVTVVNLANGQVKATICGISGAAAAPTVASSNGLLFGHPNSISATTGSPTGKIYVTSGDSDYMTIIYTDSDTVQGHINLQGRGVRVLVTTP